MAPRPPARGDGPGEAATGKCGDDVGDACTPADHIGFQCLSADTISAGCLAILPRVCSDSTAATAATYCTTAAGWTSRWPSRVTSTPCAMYSRSGARTPWTSSAQIAIELTEEGSGDVGSHGGAAKDRCIPSIPPHEAASRAREMMPVAAYEGICDRAAASPGLQLGSALWRCGRRRPTSAA